MQNTIGRASFVIPAQAGIQWRRRLMVAAKFERVTCAVRARPCASRLDPGLRRDDDRGWGTPCGRTASPAIVILRWSSALASLEPPPRALRPFVSRLLPHRKGDTIYRLRHPGAGRDPAATALDGRREVRARVLCRSGSTLRVATGSRPAPGW